MGGTALYAQPVTCVGWVVTGPTARLAVGNNLVLHVTGPEAEGFVPGEEYRLVLERTDVTASAATPAAETGEASAFDAVADVEALCTERGLGRARLRVPSRPPTWERAAVWPGDLFFGEAAFGLFGQLTIGQSVRIRTEFAVDL